MKFLVFSIHLYGLLCKTIKNYNKTKLDVWYVSPDWLNINVEFTGIILWLILYSYLFAQCDTKSHEFCSPNIWPNVNKENMCLESLLCPESETMMNYLLKV